MSRADQLRTDVAEARELLARAVAAASSHWDQAILEPEGEPPAGSWEGRLSGEAPGGWTPAEAANHVAGAEVLFVGFLAERLEGGSGTLRDYLATVEGLSPERRVLLDVSGETPEEVIAQLGQVAERTAGTLSALTDADLEQPLPLMEVQNEFLAANGLPTTQTVGTLVTLVAAHYRDHAEQIQNAIS